jgi:hypothetical protein
MISVEVGLLSHRVINYDPIKSE